MTNMFLGSWVLSLSIISILSACAEFQATQVETCGYGSGDFEDLVNSGTPLVDKSEFIEEIMNDKARVILITRPRRFGKSVNLSMLKHFLSLGSAKDIFQNMSISNHKTFCDRYQNKVPVLSIDFTDLKSALTVEEFKMNFKFLFRSLFYAHSYVLRYSIFLDKHSKDLLRQLPLEPGYEDIRLLMQLMEMHYKQKVVVLLDEYDSPILDAYARGLSSMIIPNVQMILDTIFKDNIYLYKGVIMGITEVAKENMYSGLNNVISYSVCDDLFSSHFGFTENEVEWLFKVFRKDQTNLKKAKSFYKGYKFGNTTVYNPWSVIKCLKSGGAIVKHWVHSGSADYFEQFLTGYGVIPLIKAKKLLENGVISQVFLSSTEWAKLGKNEDAFWTLITELGYLTPSNKTQSLRGWNVTLRIPNMEVRGAFREVLDQSSLKIPSCDKFYDSFKLQNDTSASKILTEYLKRSKNFFSGKDQAKTVIEIMTNLDPILGRTQRIIEKNGLTVIFNEPLADIQNRTVIIIKEEPSSAQNRPMNEKKYWKEKLFHIIGKNALTEFCERSCNLISVSLVDHTATVQMFF